MPYALTSYYYLYCYYYCCCTVFTTPIVPARATLARAHGPPTNMRTIYIAKNPTVKHVLLVPQIDALLSNVRCLKTIIKIIINNNYKIIFLFDREPKRDTDLSPKSTSLMQHVVADAEACSLRLTQTNTVLHRIM